MTPHNEMKTKIDTSRNQYGSLTDIEGLLLGQREVGEKLPITGVTAVLAPEGAAAGFECRGGAPATHETDLLRCGNLVERVQGVVLTGGSSFGLISACGVQQYLAEQHLGWRVGTSPEEVVPIVPAAAIFDLGRSNSFTTRPTFQLGYETAAAAGRGYVGEGSRGAGSGAEVGGLLGPGLVGGIGTGCVKTEDGISVAAIVVVNSAGLPIDIETGELLGNAHLNSVFCRAELVTKIAAPTQKEISHWQAYVAAETNRGKHQGTPGNTNTVIGIIATNVDLRRDELTRMAKVAHNGLARSISPIHTLFDGDTLFSLSTAQLNLGNDLHASLTAERALALSRVYECGATAVTRAVVRAVATAHSKGGLPCYRDFFPSLYDN